MRIQLKMWEHHITHKKVLLDLKNIFQKQYRKSIKNLNKNNFKLIYKIKMGIPWILLLNI